MAITGMTAAASAMVYASLAATAVSTGIGVYQSIQQGKAQQAQANYQAKVARANAQMAEQQASAERRQGYENMLNTRRKAAALIGSQRAAAGASGAAVDFGSFADVAEDTAMKAEFDAINAYNQGIDRGYNSEIQAWNYGSQAQGYEAQGSAARSAGNLGAIGTAIGGIAEMGSTWAKFQQPGGVGKMTYDPALGTYVKGGKTWTH